GVAHHGGTRPVRGLAREPGRGRPRRTCFLPSGLSPSVPEFHQVNRAWARVADCHRRLGIAPTPEHVRAYCVLQRPMLPAHSPPGGGRPSVVTSALACEIGSRDHRSRQNPPTSARAADLAPRPCPANVLGMCPVMSGLWVWGVVS